MGFWVFMLIMDLLIPLTMIGFGKYFIKNVPKKITMVFGYRTPMSMKNKETWEFAHHYCGKLWLKIGWTILFLTVIAMLFTIGKDEGIIGTVGGILCGVQVIMLIGSIFPTEIALKYTFDKQGNRKKHNSDLNFFTNAK